MKTKIAGDFPIENSNQDLFDMIYYAETLATFIMQSSTPLTISIQGEWGSGKTSLINLIANELQKNNNDIVYEVIRIDAWEFFVGNTEKSLERFALSLIDQIITRTDNNKMIKELQKVKKYSGIFISKGISILGNITQLDSKTVDDIKSFCCDDELLFIIKNLRNSISELIECNNKTQRKPIIYTFLVDDLDRIDPEASVQVLEVLKNIFNIPQCVFILSVDFDIIIRGLKRRYNDYIDGTPFNYRDYFDKLIQLSFTIPVNSYNVEPLLIQILAEYGYWQLHELSFEDKKVITDVLKLSVGNNPRKIKRLANAIHVSYLLDLKTNKFLFTTKRKIINLILLCIQQCYPEIYNVLLLFPDFTSWDDELLANYTFDFDHTSFVEDLSNVSNSIWKKCLSKLCLNSSDLKNSTPAIIKLFSCLESLISDNYYYIISQIIVLSSTTSIYPQIRYSGIDYQNNSFTQFKQGQKLVQMITPKPNSKILDIGCGNGLTTIELFSKFDKSAKINAFDISPSQIEIAVKNRDSHMISEDDINFYVMDAIDLSEIECYDLIFSNSALHWVSKPYDVYSKIYTALKPNGQIAIHQGGKDSYRGLHRIVKIAYNNLGLSDYFYNWEFPTFYPTVDEITNMLKDIGYHNIKIYNDESDGTEYSTLVDDFAKASLIFYFSRLPQEYHSKLEEEFIRQCKINQVDCYTNRIYIYAEK